MGHSARTCKLNTIFFLNPESRRPRRRGNVGQNNIKVDRERIRYKRVDWIQLARNSFCWKVPWSGQCTFRLQQSFTCSEAGRAPCMPSARDASWHMVTYSNWKLHIATERCFRFPYRSQHSSLYILSHVLRQFVAPITR